MAPQPTALRIEGFTLAVRDPERSARFYCEGLGFTHEGSDADGARLSLAGTRLWLTHRPAGAAPPPLGANAPDFQHFAIRVGDMAAAFQRIAAFDPAPISHGGPQRLPPADGCVTAWKFRDPDGHPLELLQLSPTPQAQGPLFQAIDHTALASADLGASLAVYAALGLAQGPSSHNQGDPQDRLDGLAGVDLHIATVHTREPGPHVELLHYARPAPPPAHADRAGEPFIVTRLAGDRASRLVDPDGHALQIEAAAGHAS